MATITKFEDLEIWNDARKFAQNFFETYSNSILFSKDLKLKEQINNRGGFIKYLAKTDVKGSKFKDRL